ncbi:hypothetical protein PQD69_gp099 [Carnobacterium phage cd4]|uniref:Uncharacterized protein n=1 Tax=Carnobacterium phage cd4 TaxID=2849246 RepID=A0AAE7SS48_9CAUD|nr:hypothetical protein PQD69_gp099 [Carnobacterium phage cd4]QXP45411.1 hypothetical protein cd4_099 [Carnobacterium phage cd4]
MASLDQPCKLREARQARQQANTSTTQHDTRTSDLTQLTHADKVRRSWGGWG